MSVSRMLRHAEAEDWLERQLGPALISYVPHVDREAFASVLARVEVGEIVTERAALQNALAAFAYATSATERMAALIELHSVAPDSSPSPAERAEVLGGVLRRVLADIGAAQSHKEAESIAKAALGPLSSLMRHLVENELSWPTESVLHQAL